MSSPVSRSGILAAGNFIVDHIKLIDYYPSEEMLATIRSQSSSNGGGPYNVLKDLAKMQAPFPLAALGLLGADGNGDWIVEDCQQHGIDTTGLQRTTAAATSYTDAFTVASSGRRTFFHQPGANALLDVSHLNLASSSARIFYLGYLMLLQTLDHIGADGRTGASHVLERARAAGMITVADMVSLEHENFRASAEASFPHLDWLVLNEIEAGKLLGHSLRDEGGIIWSDVQMAADELVRKGIREGVVIHFVEGAAAATREGGIARTGSVRLPPDFIKGATGAGDAFAAGFLYGLHEHTSLQECLSFAVSAAALCLSDATTSGGLGPLEKCLQLCHEFGFRDCPR